MQDDVPMHPKPKRLGRGLAALLEPDLRAPRSPTSLFSPALQQSLAFTKTQDHQENIQLLTITDLVPCKFQPRRTFSHESLQELVQSLKEKGLLNPLLVREIPGERYEVIAGERRLRAASQLGWHTILCRVLLFSDEEVLEIALLENIQRADLNTLEEALGYQRLIKDFHYTQEKIAERVGKSRSHVANHVRLLQLPDSILSMLESGHLTAGHARSLLGSKDPETLAKRIIDQGLNVRQAERLVQQEEKSKEKMLQNTPLLAKEEGGYIQELTNQFISLTGLAAKVRVKKDQSGVVEIYFQSPGDIDKLLQRLTGTTF